MALLSRKKLRLLTATGFAAAAVMTSPAFAQAARPNIVVIQTDDQSAKTVKATFRDRAGDNRLVMPNTMREIFRSGTEFTNYYASTPLCSPSRASMLTGQYPANSGLIDNYSSGGGWFGWQTLPTWDNNLPLALQAAGYRTMHLGKYLNGYYDAADDKPERIVPPGWDRWYTTTYRIGTQFYGYRLNDNGVIRGPFGDPQYKSKGPTVDPKRCTAKLLQRPRLAVGCNYLTDRMTRQAVKEIKHSGRSPFYLQIDYQAPHGDVRPPIGPQPAPRHFGSANRTWLPRGSNYNEKDISDKPPLIQSIVPQRLGPAQHRRVNNDYRREIESLRSVDDGIGAIIDTLRKTGRLKNTYVFYVSDHGVFLGEHRFDYGKFLPYEPSTHVAMAVRGPGVPRRGRSREVVGNIDFAPTALALAGTNAGYVLDGQPLGRFWHHPSRITRRPFGITFPTTDEVDVPGGGASVSARAPALKFTGFRVGPYKYVHYDDVDQAELYDLGRDPAELDNVIDAPAYAAVKGYMEFYLPSVAGCTGADCRRWLAPWPQPSPAPRP